MPKSKSPAGSARRSQPRPEAARVLFASSRVTKPEASYTLPAKFKRMLDQLDLASICQGALVPIKLHLGGGIGYTTIHPVFIRTLVDAIKATGARPFIVDGYFDTIASAADRGYTAETLGCPLVSAGGPYDKHVVSQPIGYRQLDEARIFGAIWDAPCLINFSHVKGHGACGYGGACKNIAMGCVDGATRGKIHALEGGIDWTSEVCVFCGQCVKACDTQAIQMDREGKAIRIFFHNCRYCRHCVSACPVKALKMSAKGGYRHFQEGMALTTKAVMDSFAAGRSLHINLLTNITMFCDCWGMSTPALVPDIGLAASTDMVALEKACLDMIKTEDFIPGSLVGGHTLGPGTHLFEKIHGKDPMVQVKALERLGVGTTRYTLVPVV